MALIECKNCGRRVSDQALKCPQCGLDPKINQKQQLEEQKRRKKKNLKIFSFSIVGFLVVYFIFDFILINANGCAIFYSSGDPTYEYDPYNIQYTDSLFRMAQNGDADAQADLGSCYSDGIGVAQNEKEALKWFEASASQNNPKGQHRLANLYWFGRGITKDTKKATELYEKAAKGGYPTANYVLSNMYLFGDGLTQNEKKGLDYLRKAAKLGYAPAEALYGVLLISEYERPGSLHKNIPLGLTYLTAAAEKDYAPAYDQLGIFCDTVGYGTIENGAIASYNEKTLPYLQKAADLGFSDAQYHLGNYLYFNGNSKDGMKWWYEAAKQGNENAISEYKKRFLIWNWF